MNKMIATGLMTLTMALAVWAEPVEKNSVNQPAPAPVVTTTGPAAQPEVKKEQASQPAPAPAKKPVELNFRTF